AGLAQGRQLLRVGIISVIGNGHACLPRSEQAVDGGDQGSGEPAQSISPGPHQPERGVEQTCNRLRVTEKPQDQGQDQPPGDDLAQASTKHEDSSEVSKGWQPVPGGHVRPKDVGKKNSCSSPQVVQVWRASMALARARSRAGVMGRTGNARWM